MPETVKPPCRPGDSETEKKIGEIYQDLESVEGWIYVVCSGVVYGYEPTTFMKSLAKYCKKSMPVEDIGVKPEFMTDDVDEEDWVRRRR
jgi:hypothetical protein